MLILTIKFQKQSKNTDSGVPFCIFWDTPLFYCLQTMETIEKTMGTIDFQKIIGAIEKYYYSKYID